MLNVVVADDHRLVREGLVRLLKWDAGVEVVGKAHSGGQALALARALRPDVLLLDLTMEDMDGLQVLAALHAEEPKLQVIVVSVHDDRSLIEQALATGAAGYLCKNSVAVELAIAVQAVGSGGTYLCKVAQARLAS